MENGIKAVFFDMDGTLIDSVGIWNKVDEALILSMGKRPIEDIQKTRDRVLSENKEKDNPYVEYCSYLGKKYDSDMTGEEIHRKRYEIAHDYLVNVIDYREAADVFIKKLKDKGLRLAIVSSTRRDNMEIYRKKNSNITGKAKLDEYFEKIYTREDADKLKPDPAIYLMAMSDMGLSPDECIAFEDSLIGVKSAKAAGIRTVAIYDSYSQEEWEEIKNRADYNINGYDEIID